MRTPSSVIALAAAQVILSSVFALAPAAADEPQKDATAALASLQTWLNAGPNAKGWNAYLQLTALEAELPKGSGADPAVVDGVLKQLDSQAPGLELAPFRKLRDALSLWSTDLVVAKAPSLSAAIGSFESRFAPLTAEHVAGDKAALQASLAKLDRFLTAQGANGTAWRDYLHWKDLDAQLKSEAPDLKVLESIEKQFVADQDGLELPEFFDVGTALERYVNDLTGQKEDLKAQFNESLKSLAEELRKYTTDHSQELAAAIGGRLGWLQSMGQLKQLVSLVRSKISHPNLFAAISGRLVAAGVNQPVDDHGPVRDVILGTDISGTAHTVGHIYVQLVPNDDKAVIEATLIGTAESRTVGYNGPATINSSGTTQLRGTKLIMIDEYGFTTTPAKATAATKTQILGVGAGRGGIAQRVASNRVYESKSQAEQIAGQHAAVRARVRVDSQAKTQTAKSQADYLKNFRNPLVRKREFPELMKFRTTRESLFVTMLQASRSQLGAPNEPPKISVTSDLAAQTHESWVNSMAGAMLSGKTLNQEEVEAKIVEIRGSLPEQLKSDESRGPWSITLADADPITVRFPENGMQITIRGRRYKSGDDTFRAMNVTAEYQIEKNGEQFVLKRQGELRIFPPDFEPGKKLSTRQVTLSTLLRKKFGKMFEPEIKAEGLILPGRWKQAGILDLKQMESKGGWLAVAWLQSGRPAPEDDSKPEGNNKVAGDKR